MVCESNASLMGVFSQRKRQASSVWPLGPHMPGIAVPRGMNGQGVVFRFEESDSAFLQKGDLCPGFPGNGGHQIPVVEESPPDTRIFQKHGPIEQMVLLPWIKRLPTIMRFDRICEMQKDAFSYIRIHLFPRPRAFLSQSWDPIRVAREASLPFCWPSGICSI